MQLRGPSTRPTTRHRRRDRIPRFHTEPAEIRQRIWKPLIPAVVARGARAAGCEVVAGLQDGITVGVAVDADPGGGGVGAAAAGGGLGGGDSEGADDLGEGGARGGRLEDDAGPVGGVLDLDGVVVNFGGREGARGGDERGGVVGEAESTALDAVFEGGEGGGDGGGEEGEGSEGGWVMHVLIELGFADRARVWTSGREDWPANRGDCSCS